MNERTPIPAKPAENASLSPVPSGLLQRKCACGGTPGVDGECEECRKKRLRGQAEPAPPIVHEVLRSPGQPLDPAHRAFMGARLGHDFSRVHTDAKAAESARAVGALAYTVGRDVVFGSGQYLPDTPSGTSLLVHELAHVVQQEPGLSDHSDLRLGPGDDTLEREADAAAGSIASAQNGAAGSRASEHILQRAAVGPDDPDLVSPGSTLPYREATELLECIRIMGEENAAFCRQEVLGEQPQPTPPPPPCSPTGLPRAQYLAQPGTSTDDFGLTTLAGTVTVPAVHTTRARGGVRLDETAAALPPITSVFTQADTFTEGTAIFTSQGGGCPSDRYPIRWTIFPDGARKIREGELEHCADFQHAFEISLKRYAEAVNRLARSGRTFTSQRAAEAHISRLVGANPANWSDIFECLAKKTQSRDGPKGFPGWHTPRPRMIEPRLETNCAFTRAVISGISLPEVGRHPPDEIIRDCGEGGAASGGQGRSRGSSP